MVGTVLGTTLPSSFPHVAVHGWGAGGAGATGVRGESDTAHGIVGVTAGNFKAGVYGENTGNSTPVGVLGFTTGSNGVGVQGQSNDVAGTGVYGLGLRYGVWGQTGGAGAAAVYGEASQAGTGVSGVGAIGVWGTGISDIGVLGQASNLTALPAPGVRAGVYGTGAGPDQAPVGFVGVMGASDTSEGVSGVSVGGIGVKGSSTSGPGMEGVSIDGAGGSFVSKVGPQLHLEPKSTGTGAPTTGSFAGGDFWLDSAGGLFLCIAGGTPGVWRQIHTTQTVALAAGWSLVSGPGLSTDQIKSQIDAAGGSVTALAAYSGGKYVTWVPGKSANFFVPTTAGMYVLSTCAAAWMPH
jgi:hypothetical protein